MMINGYLHGTPLPVDRISASSRNRVQALEAIKLFSCSTQLRMKFFLLMNVKMPTIVGILTFTSEQNSILGLSEPKNSRIS